MLNEKSVEGVILAAGMSSRAGSFKPALPIGGRSMIAHCIEGMFSVCGRIVVVGGNEIEKLRALVEGYDRVECIENVDYAKGMFTSVKAGLAAARGDRCFLLPTDIPLVPPGVYRRLLACDAEVVLPAFQGKNGHPVCLSKAVIPRILRVPDDSSLRDVIRAIGFQAVEVEAEEILIDVDTLQDYESVCRRFV
jgi:molybdenum cofactor cytidylyltransferase